MTDRPLVATLHGNAKLGPVYSLVGDRVRFVTPTASFRSFLRPLNAAGVVPYGLDIQSYGFEANKDDFVLFIGRAVPQKGLHLAIRAARAAGLPLTAVAVRRGLESERAYWERVIEPLLGSDVTIIDEVGFDEKADLMSRARALLFPIDWEEPFGIVMIEAMACGTPVLATRRASAPEVVQHGKTGFLFPVRTYVSGAAEALSTALERIDARDCRMWVEEHFSKEHMVLGYEEEYEQILAAGRDSQRPARPLGRRTDSRRTGR